MAASSDFKLVLFLHCINIGVVFTLLHKAIPCLLKPFCLGAGTSLLFLLVSYSCFKYTRKLFLNDFIQAENKAVFITGCDNGFGSSLSKRLDSRGIKVFAGCTYLSSPGAQELQLQCSSRLKTLQIDVTSDESVKKALEYVKLNLEDSELWAVVNTADVFKGLDFDLSSTQDFIDCLEINCLGLIRVIKAFLPLLRRSKGRIVNVTSCDGRFASPRRIAYVSSKFAATGLNDALRFEMDLWGVRVISVEPDVFKTNMMNIKHYDEMIDSAVKAMDPSPRDYYREEYFEKLKKSMKISLDSASPNMNNVITALESAVCSKFPETVYRPAESRASEIKIKLLSCMNQVMQDKLLKYINS